MISTDALFESAVLLLKHRPLDFLRLPVWLLGGKARLKAKLAERVVPDAASLPYCAELLEFLRAEKAAGRRIVLATASHRRIAEAVARHLDLFDEVLATDEGTNLGGAAKLAALEARFGKGGFDYVGNAKADLPIWAACGTAYAVGPAPGVRREMRAVCTPGREFAHEAGGGVAALVKAVRPHQWVKNALVALPLVLAHKAGDLVRLTNVAWAVVAFCLVASSVYVANDLLDLEADRHHPRKRRRPLASGAISIPAGVGLTVALLVGGFGAAVMTGSVRFVLLLALYLALSTAYSVHFKRRMLVDVFILAGLYAHRIIAGAVAADVPLTVWLLAFSMFLFLSLAFAKRYSELVIAEEREEQGLKGRGYLVSDLRVIESVGPTSGYLAVMVMSLYLNSDLVRQQYAAPQPLWLICPLVLYWVTRVWFIARRRTLVDDPVVFALRDRVSWMVAVICAGLMIAARKGWWW